MNLLKCYTIISLGCVFYAVGYTFFLEPAHLAAGGISGIALMITHFYRHLDTGIIIFLLNLPLLIIGAVISGKHFLFGTIWATAISSGMISFLEQWYPLPFAACEPYTCAVLGALLTGVGMGLIFRFHATTGGTDILVHLIQKKFPQTKTGYLFLSIDTIIVLVSGFVFQDAAVVFFSGLTLFGSSLIINLILYGRNNFPPETITSV